MNFTEAGIEEDILREYGGMVHFPALQRYVKKYAASLGGNDQKSIKLFKFYETSDRLRELELEIMHIKDEKASLYILRQILGNKREGHFGSFSEWAKRMLLWKNAQGQL